MAPSNRKRDPIIDETLPMYLIMCSYRAVMASELAQPNKPSADRLSFFLLTTVHTHANIC